MPQSNGQPTEAEVQAALSNPNATALATPTITSDSLQPPTTSLQPVPPPVEDLSGLMGNIGATTDYVNTLTTQQTAQEKANAINQNSITSLLTSLEGKSADTNAAAESTGLNAATQQLNNLNAQAKSLNRAAQAIPIQTQENNSNTGATDAGVAPQTAGELRKNALKALSIAQQADVATANWQAAKDKTQQIVDLKYAPMEAHLETLKQQYEFNKDSLSRIDAKRTEALGIALKQKEQKLADEKAMVTKNLNMVLTAQVKTAAVNQNGRFFDSKTGKDFETPEEFFKAYNVKSFEEAYQKGLVTDVNGAMLADMDFAAQAAAKYMTAGILPTDDQATIANKIKATAQYKKENYIAPPAGGGSGGVLGLTNQQIDNINPLVTSFNNSDIVKNYNTIGEQINAVRSAGDTPADDIQRIYAFAKVMDPNSVVREGEYKTVQDYATTLLQKTGIKANRVFNNDGFLTKEARSFLLNTLENRFKSSETSYKNLSDETARRINLIGGTDKGSQLLNNYSAAFVVPPSTKSLYTPDVVNELRSLAKTKGYNDADLQEMADKNYTPDQIRELLK